MFPIRGLRRGDQGAKVIKLQKRLVDWGYDPGPVDGVFGHLTEEALLLLQRQFRLQVDGIAGKRVFSLLNLDPPQQYITYEAESVTSPEEVAKTLGVDASLVRRVVGKHLVYRGQRLLLPKRIVWGVWERPGGELSLIRQAKSLSGVARPHVQILADGKLQTGGREWLGVAAERRVQPWALVWGEEGSLLSALSGKGWKKVAEGLKRLDSGLLLDLGYLPPHLMRPLRSLIRALEGKDLSLVLPGRPCWNSPYKIEELWESCRYLVIRPFQLHRTGPILPREETRKVVKALIREAPSWRLLLGLPLFAKETIGQDGMERLSYSQALGEAARYGERLRRTPEGLVVNWEGESPGEIWVEDGESLAWGLSLVTQYNLGGAVLWGMGEEDPRVWGKIPSFFAIHREDGSNPRKGGIE